MHPQRPTLERPGALERRRFPLPGLGAFRFIVEAGVSRVFDEPQREAFLPIIGAMAAAAGGDAESAVQDAIPFQYVFRAVVVRAD